MRGDKASFSRKRKSTILASKTKHLRIDSEEIFELKLTREEAQRLLRPPPNHAPNIVIIEGFEFEEYEVLFFLLRFQTQMLFLEYFFSSLEQSVHLVTI